MQNRIWRGTACGLIVACLMACGSSRIADAQSSKLKVLTYNIQWFSEEADPGRISNLKEILEDLKPDIVAVQEIQSKKALQQIFGPEWTILMKDDPRENQEVGLAIRKPIQVLSSGLVFDTPSLDFSFPGARDVMRAEVQLANGQKLSLYSLHQKSRRGGRKSTDPQRTSAAGMLASYIAARPSEQAIVMGDFNDGSDDLSLNILETGNLMAKAGKGSGEPSLMVTLTEKLDRQDYVSIGLQDLWLGEDIEPIVKGAYEENMRLQGRDYEFPRDVKITQSFFDHILVSPSLSAKATIKVYSKSAALRGSRGRVQVDDKAGTVTYTQKGSQASDHLPVFAEIDL